VRLLGEPEMAQMRRVERTTEDSDARRGAGHSRIWPVPSATYL
jgi:hypothetical protein